MRWLGVPLLALGALGLVAALALAIEGSGRWSAAMLYVGASGLSLAVFGTHNDTALALMARHSEGLSGDARAELDDELSRDKGAALALKATPKTAWGITVVALLLHAAALARLLL